MEMDCSNGKWNVYPHAVVVAMKPFYEFVLYQVLVDEFFPAHDDGEVDV